MKINIFKNNKKILLESISRIEEIRLKSDIIAICPVATGYSWLGVNTATKSLFLNNTFEIPQNYSNSIFLESELDQLVKVINDIGFKQVILNGHPPYFNNIVKKIKNVNSHIKIKVIYHGHLSEFTKNTVLQKLFKSIIDLKIEGLIDDIGFGKEGLSLSVNKIFKLNSKYIPLINKPFKNIQPYDKNLNIGVLVNDSYIKNYHNMIFSAYMKEESKIHVALVKDIQYIPDMSRIVSHGLIPQEKFIDVLGSMTLNLHTTFSEASGGLVCSESIAQGVPCISSYTSSFFDYDEELKKKLVVDGYDDSWHIYQKIESVLKERDYLSRRCIDYAILLNSMAEERINLFLDN